MSKLTNDLISLAETHARKILCDLHHPLMPTWVLIDAKNKISIIGTPWHNDLEKDFYAKTLRAEMRKRKIRAYSFVTEAWRAVVPPETDLETVRASTQPNKQEVVIAMAVDGEDREMHTWVIERDWNERVTGLSLQPDWPGEPEGWMLNMLKKSRSK